MLRHICYPVPPLYLPSPGCFKGWIWLKNLSWIKHYQYSNYIEVYPSTVLRYQRQSVCQSVNPLSSQEVKQSVGQPASQSVNQLSVSQWINLKNNDMPSVSQSVFGCVDDNHTDYKNHLGMERSKYNPATQHKTSKQQWHTNKESEYTWSGSF